MNSTAERDALACQKNASTALADADSERRERCAPSVDVVEFDDAYVVTAEMPGVCDDAVDVDFQNGELTIYGRVADCRRREDATRRTAGFEPKDYYRSFRVGNTIDSDKIEADFCDGLLTLRLPKRQEIQPRKIAVNQKSDESES
ncbi:MAG: Hsp20/alpha crystallin family protein [Thermoguttaceae bacterium]|nr:Hsp20/alpha crystallin family protein [Thermoguttaceae bacterium]MBQ9799296.1 Hsp20/alpha crystallin family protein [Thermoguttaceae bacterium]